MPTPNGVGPSVGGRCSSQRLHPASVSASVSPGAAAPTASAVTADTGRRVGRWRSPQVTGAHVSDTAARAPPRSKLVCWRAHRCYLEAGSDTQCTWMHPWAAVHVRRRGQSQVSLQMYSQGPDKSRFPHSLTGHYAFGRGKANRPGRNVSG